MRPTFQQYCESKVLSESTHPLDRKVEGNFGLTLPEDNYHRQVYHALLSILEHDRGISEKDFRRMDEIMAESNSIVRSRDEFIVECEQKGMRPALCAELIYHDMRTK